ELERAWQSGGEQCQLAPSTTLASGISVDIPADGAMALRAVRDTGGALIECEDEELLEGIAALARKTAVFAEPSAAASYVALVKARAQGLIGSADEVVLQLTGNGLKDTKSALRAAGAPRVISSLDEV
ncbi:MAG TPA: pyridoxal-phosphate dependent enzyme, partial [Thermoflexales bacterium]|nr:pyridoxal-phosphate dependent enzyme [Thermoflexales bacterium]